MLRAFVDLDGVLVDFHAGVLKFYNVNPDKIPEPPLPWNWLPKHIGIDDNAFVQLLHESFWVKLDWTDEGYEILRLLERKYDEVVIVSNPCHVPHAAAGKLLWLEKHLPMYKDKCFLGAPKHLLAAPGRLLVDDNDSNISAFTSEGGEGILVPRLWNSNFRHDTLQYVRRMLCSPVDK